MEKNNYDHSHYSNVLIVDLNDENEYMNEQERDSAFKHHGDKKKHLDEVTLIATPLVISQLNN